MAGEDESRSTAYASDKEEESDISLLKMLESADEQMNFLRGR